MGIAHNEPAKTEDWFHWKFEQSPYGPAILATAFDGDRVAGCVAYGKGVVRYKNKDWTCALSYETYVHPDYQGKGLFKKLILLAEDEMKKQNIDFAYNFPNSNSLPGFKRMDWLQANEIRQYKIKLLNPLKVLFHATDIKKVFVPNESNMAVLPKDISEHVMGIKRDVDDDVIVPIWNREYLKWRFLTYPNREYLIQDTSDYFCASMVGQRGCLKVVEILYMEAKNGHPTNRIFKAVIRDIKKSANPDILAYTKTPFDDTIDGVWGFIGVPSHANFCYKYFNEKMSRDGISMLIPSINAHTY